MSHSSHPPAWHTSYDICAPPRGFFSFFFFFFLRRELCFVARVCLCLCVKVRILYTYKYVYNVCVFICMCVCVCVRACVCMVEVRIWEFKRQHFSTRRHRPVFPSPPARHVFSVIDSFFLLLTNKKDRQLVPRALPPL